MIVLPAVLILLAVAAAAVVAFGTHPDWMVFRHGLGIIMAAHRLQWPLTFLAMLLCVALLALVVSGKRRAVWVLGLAPVIGLLAYHFRSGPMRGFAVADNPPLVSAGKGAGFLGEDDYVVGLQWGESAYAFPYALLYANPVVLHVERGRRLLLMWSPFANHATAYQVDRNLRGPELAIVSMPANALLLYNGRLGQFINGLTGQTPAGKRPTGFYQPVPTVKTTWKHWRGAHPQTRVLALPPRYTGLPRRPVLPYFPTPGADPAEAGARVTVVNAGPNGIAVPAEKVTTLPLNLTPDAGAPVVLFRDPQAGFARAFDRRFDPEVAPEFRPASNPPGAGGAALLDGVTGSGWTLSGRAVSGDARLRGMRLSPVPVDEDLPLEVVRYWYPQVTLLDVGPEDYARAMDPAPPVRPAAPERQRTRRR